MYVYEPEYPTQRLPDTPELIISPPQSQPGLPGYVDAATPHSINNLLVDFLGEDEILLLCCDDGDVIGYRTKAIREAISPDERSMTPWKTVRTPKHFFLDNVGRSAWGLSIHREARMIAISANTCRITVIAFALSDGRSPRSESPEGSPEPDVEEDPSDFPFPRKKHHRIVLPRTGANIPCVSFCNTGQDLHGQWLLSCDIEGRTFVWDLHAGREMESPPSTIRMRFCPNGINGCRCGPLSHMAWKASWLDRRAFRKAESIQQASGSNNVSITSIEGHTFLRNSCSRNEILNRAEHFSSPDYAGHFTDQLDSDSEESTIGAETMDETSSNEHTESPPKITATATAPEPPINAELPGRSMPPGFPSSPIIFVNSKDLFLIGAPRRLFCSNDTSLARRTTITAFYDPLHQTLPPVDGNLLFLPRYDRMNLFCEIPELGVFVSGSGVGRAAILTLNYVPRDASSASKDTRLPGSPTGSTYTFRVEHILPFASQEMDGERPETVLIGITVGPVQGSLGHHVPKLPRRWRLILYYCDHTVFSYEISREQALDAETNVEALIV